MNLKQTYIKLFLKNKAVIIKKITESGRMTSHWAIPSKENTVKINETSDAVVLHKDARLLSTKHNIPTYVVHYRDCQPILLDDLQRKGIYGTEELRLILDNTEAEKIFRAGNKSSISQEAKMIILVLIFGFIGLGYYVNTLIPKPVEPEPIPIVEVIDDGEE